MCLATSQLESLASKEIITSWSLLLEKRKSSLDYVSKGNSS